MFLSRRNFIKKTSLSTAVISTASLLINCEKDSVKRAPSGGTYMGGFVSPKLSTVRAAFIGVGSRGGEHLKNFAELAGTEVVAISDLYEDNVKQKLDMVKQLETRGSCFRGGAAGSNPQRPLAYCGHLRKDKQALYDDGKCQLW